MVNNNQNDESTDSCLSFDDFLSHLGEFGCYQKRLLIYTLPFTFLWAWAYLGHIFIILVPNQHWCYISELQGVSKDRQIELAIPKIGKHDFDRCNMYDRNYTEVLEEKIPTENKSWPQIPCRDWVYDRNEVLYETIATELNWVCDNKVLGAYTVAISFSGSIIGSLIFGYMSDYWGRVPAVMLANFCALFGGILSAFCKSFFWFSVTRFIVGLAIDYCCAPIYVLLLEYIGPKYRAKITNFMLSFSYVPAESLLPWIALWTNDWRLFTLVTSIPIIIPLLLYFFIQESARWLISVGKFARAMRIARYVAKVNGKTLSDDFFIEFEKCCLSIYDADQSSEKCSVLSLFRSLRLCLLTVNLITCWMIISLVYDAHIRVITDIGPDIFITFSVAALVELPAALVAMFCLDFTGRKIMSILSFMGCAAGSILAALLNIKWQIAISATFGRFCANIAYSVIFQWSAEILPTVVRGQGLALIQIMGFVAAFLSPFVVYAKVYSPIIPMLIISGLSVLAALLVILLPDTTNVNLPRVPEDTVKLSKTFKWKNSLTIS